MKVFLGTAIFVFIACFTATYWIAGNLYLWNEFHYVVESYTDLFIFLTSYTPLSYLGVGNIVLILILDYYIVREVFLSLIGLRKRNTKSFQAILED